MANVAKLASVATLDSTGFSRGLATMRVDVGAFSAIALGAFGKIGTAITTSLSRALAAIPRFATEGLAMGDALSDSANVTGIAADKLTTYYRAAKLAELGTGEFDMMVHRLNVNVAEAIKGDAKFAGILHKAGVDLEKIANLTPEETFLTLADAISKTKNVYDRAFIAQQAFGRGGSTLLPLLSGGRAGISNLATSTRALGAAPSKLEIKNIARANDAMQDLGTALTGLKLTIAKEIALPVTDAAKDLLDWLAKNRVPQKVGAVVSAPARTWSFMSLWGAEAPGGPNPLNPGAGDYEQQMERLNADIPYGHPFVTQHGTVLSRPTRRDIARRNRAQARRDRNRLRPSPGAAFSDFEKALKTSSLYWPTNKAQPEYLRGEGDANPFTRGPRGGLLPNPGWRGKPITQMSNAEVDSWLLRMKGGSPGMSESRMQSAARVNVREQEVKDQALIDVVQTHNDKLDQWIRRSGGGMGP